ncbi:hypothetical protein SADUNF_Sadunf05G0024400 [Salix dunnii]|uniref:Malectin-like domain-containing protein n=1 Tax=Salix dunnii TaxID=1413687 RepID=A0A835N3H3_9ROSI|nr:hypothetical protein SADUNF_Sadunf05G0024400 [Salix dunnii]
MAGCLVIFFLAFLSISGNADDVSIDCGASDTYTDENSIVWIGDDDIFKNSQSEVVQSSNTVSHVMSTLRVFTSLKKNCYTITADNGTLVLVRASFFYGNYDKKSSPPSFHLLFHGNYWATVNTTLDQLVYYEVMYVVKSDTTSICLAQTHPNQLPFISALEVRNLDSKMYAIVDPNYALFLRSRVAYGANSTVRFPDDRYDRIWRLARIGSGLVSVASDAKLIDVANAPDNPPPEVLQNAVTTSSSSGSITLNPGFPDQDVSVYMNFYFSEVTVLGTTQKRSFNAYIDNIKASEPIIPPYGEARELIANFTASANTSISLVATTDSTLPPLINAVEVFYVSGRLTDGTDSKDVEGLGELRNSFSVLQEIWSGDPCLPSPYTWDRISCSNDVIPRVTALDLSSLDLSGPLPDFSSMDALVTIDLHNNSITGPIPDFLGALANLEDLNLADNSFSGPIPPSISSNKKLKLVASGNPNLCVSGKSCQPTSTDGTITKSSPSGGGNKAVKGKKRNKLSVILGTTIPIFLIILAILGCKIYIEVVPFLVHQNRKTAAIAVIAAGQTGGANTKLGKVDEAVINEIRVNNIQHHATTSENAVQLVRQHIDCGASETYTDENSLVWIGDDGFFKNSQSAVVQSSNTVSHVMSTLRVFTSLKKNCYSFTADKGTLVLVRASFFYGNYDKKSSPPSFHLLFDGNYWANVKTTLDELVSYEVMYVVKSDTSSICLAQTQPYQLPFISALEVRILDSKMYGHVDTDYALFLRSRVAYGANSTVRFPDDVYDRIWVPARIGSGIVSVASDAILIDVANAPDNPPPQVLHNAITTSSSSGSITLNLAFPDQDVSVCMNFYFSEVTELDTTQKRSFKSYIDNYTPSEPIIPPYGEAMEIPATFTASAKTSISLVSTFDSTLPPLINAVEVFYVSGRLTDGTDSKDVQGLGELRNSFSILQEYWSGDPCLPSAYTWDRVSCSNDVIPRVTALDLSSLDLSGPLPDFSSMDALVTIDLHNNSITGPIPDFLGALANLENLADNSFRGPLPPSISSNKWLKLVVSGNPNLCVSGKSCQPPNTDGTIKKSTPSKGRIRGKMFKVLLGTTISSFMVILSIVGASHVLLVLAFFVFSAIVDAQVTVYCQPSDYTNEALMQWMYDNGISCLPITGTTTPSTSSKMTEVDCEGSIFYVDENVLQWIYDNNLPCQPTRKRKSNKLPIILGTVIPIFFLFWAIVGFVFHHRRKTAAIAAITAGQVEGATKPTDQGSLCTDGIKINIHDQTIQGIVSIDCGASRTYTDENSIDMMESSKNSQSGVVRSSNTVSHVMSILRVFTSLKKNCFSITVYKGSLVLVRASFFYGNYDKKSSPPSFHLLFDGNYWANVKTTLDQKRYNKHLSCPNTT